MPSVKEISSMRACSAPATSNHVIYRLSAGQGQQALPRYLTKWRSDRTPRADLPQQRSGVRSMRANPTPRVWTAGQFSRDRQPPTVRKPEEGRKEAKAHTSFELVADSRDKLAFSLQYQREDTVHLRPVESAYCRPGWFPVYVLARIV